MSGKKKFFRVLAILSVVFIFAGCTNNSGRVSKQSQPIRVSLGDADASEPAIAAAPDGSVYIAWVNHGPNAQADVMLARFTSEGQPEDSPVRVNPRSGTATAWRGDPPTVAVASDKTVYVGWTGRVESGTGHANVLYLSASRDRGHTFGPPTKVNDDSKPGGHGMHSLAVEKDGRVFVAWLDERNVVLMPAKGMKMDSKSSGHHMESNRELFFSSSADGGRTFSANKSLAKDVCPCCKTGLAVGPEGRLYVSWRQVLPGDFRHIAVSWSVDGGKSFSDPVIVSDDQWSLKGCPVSGAALASASDGIVRVLWYAGSDNSQQGIYWSESHDGGRTFHPRSLAAPGFAHSTPVLVLDSQNSGVALWEASANGKPEVHASTFGNSQPLMNAIVVASGELPTAVVDNDQLLVAYVVKNGDKRSVWLQTITKNLVTSHL